MSEPIDYTNPPRWLAHIFKDVYGEDLSGPGPSAMHMIVLTLLLACSLDACSDGHYHGDSVRELLKHSFEGVGGRDGDGLVMISACEEMLSSFEALRIDDRDKEEMEVLLVRLKDELARIGAMMKEA